MMKQKKTILVLLLLLLPVFTLTACQKKGKLNEGDCKCNVYFTNIPKEFSMLEQNLFDAFEINVRLENTINNTQYEIVLNQKNDYAAQIRLHPGTYRVCDISNNMEKYNGITLAANVENIELSPGTVGELAIVIDNLEKFNQSWMATQPMPEMLLADKFSRQLQINRKVINIADILCELDWTPEKKSPVNPGQKMTLTNEEYGITVTVLNNTGKELSWQECDVISICVTKNTVVFPEGVTLGMASEKVLDKKSGLYGEPDACTGSLLFGWQFDDTRFIYNDSVSGDQITVDLSPDTSYIKELTYEFALFE